MFHNVLMVAFTDTKQKDKGHIGKKGFKRKASRKERGIYEKNHTRSN